MPCNQPRCVCDSIREIMLLLVDVESIWAFHCTEAESSGCRADLH